MNKYMRAVWTAFFVTSLIVVSMAPLLTPVSAYAQDEPETPKITYVGSAYVGTELMDTLIEAYGNPDQFDFNLDGSGNDRGFELFCAGQGDFTMSTRAITDTEILNCETAGVQFIEVILAGEALVFVPSIERPDVCFEASNLSDLFGVGYDPEFNWTDISPFVTDSNLVTLYGPNVAEPEVSGLLQFLLTAGGTSTETAYRSDYNQEESPAQKIVELSKAETPDVSALAFMTFAEWSALEDKGGLVPLEFTPDNSANCATPTDETVVTGAYGAGRNFSLYINAAGVQDPTSPLYSFLQFVLQNENGIAKVSKDRGFTAPPQFILDQGWQNITDARIGRTFTRVNLPFNVNPAATGTLTINGSGLPMIALKPAYDTFTQQYYATTLQITSATDADSWQKFCTGSAGIIQVTRPPTVEELELCKSNGVVDAEGTNLNSIFLGADAVVLMVKADSALPVCLNYDQIKQILVDSTTDPASESLIIPEDAETSFVPPSNVTEGIVLMQDGGEGDGQEGEGGDGEGDEDVPLYDPEDLQGPDNWVDIAQVDLPLRVLVPPLGILETDIILSRIGASQNFLRTDAPIVQASPVVQERQQTDATTGFMSDLDYRIASTAALDGIITYAFWSDVQSRESQDPIRLLAIDANTGNCIEPNADSLMATDEAARYPFAFSAYVYYSDAALSTATADSGFNAAFIWNLYTDDTLNLLQEQGLVGFDPAPLAASREGLFDKISTLQNIPVVEKRPLPFGS